VGIFLFTNRCFKRDRLLGDLDDLSHPFNGKTLALPEFLHHHIAVDRDLTAFLPGQLCLYIILIQGEHFLRDLFNGRIPSQFLEQMPRYLDEPVYRLYHMNRYPDSSCLVCKGPRDGLSNPPGCIGAEFIAFLVVELLDCPYEAQVALLDQVEEEHSPAHILLGNTHHKAQVCFYQLSLGFPA